MREAAGDLWTFPARWRVVPTNGTVRKDGALVMGRGVALQAATRFPELPADFGEHVRRWGLTPALWEAQGLVYFPVKRDWWDRADLALIERSAWGAASIFRAREAFREGREAVALPRVGCGNGRLAWAVVRPVLAAVLTEDNWVVVHPEGG